jgi:probable F420-dependent oxidoreductase
MGAIKIGLNLMRAQELTGGQFSGLLELAQLADEMGVDEVHVSDHVVISPAAFARRYSRDGVDPSNGLRFPFPMDFAGWYEPLAVLSAIAAVTRRTRLSTNVLVAPLRPAILLAKQLATLDVISNGRVDAAFGVGWQKEEFDAAEIRFEGRYRYVEEQIRVCRTLWGGAPASFEGERVRFKDFYSLPLPVQGANIPISLGVRDTPHNIARIARVADGWFPSALHGPEIGTAVAALKKAFAENGRDPEALIVRTALRMTQAHTMTLDQAFADGPVLKRNGATIIVGQPQLVCRSTKEWKPYIERLLELKA